jgi:hypothetical protein
MSHGIRFIGSWGIIETNNPSSSESIEKIRQYIENSRDKVGSFDIYKIPPQKIGPERVQVFGGIVDEKIEYAILLSNNVDDTGCNIEVRTSLNMRNSTEEIEFPPYVWSRRMLVDFDYMQKVVFEFVTTGDVSRELLDS